MPVPIRITLVVALSLVGATLIAGPAIASSPTSAASPAPHTAGSGGSTDGDEILVPGAQPDFDHKSTVKHTLTAGAGGSTSSGVEEVWVSVVTATKTSSDDVNGGMTETAVKTLIGQLNSYWSAQSDGAVSIQLGGFETRAIGESSCAPNSVLTSEEQNAFGGKFARDAWLGTHSHLLVLTKESCGSESFATVGGSGGEIFSGNGLSSSMGMPYLLHEFGHNLGFEHADASICANSTSFDSSIANFAFTSTTCPTTEYDDYLDIMGYTVKDATPNLSSPQRILAGWLTDYLTATSATATRTVTLSPLGGTTGTRALKIIDPTSGQAYYVEYRTPQGRDKTSAEFRYKEQCGSAHSGYTICNLGSSTTSGIVRILRALPLPGETAQGTTVLATGTLSGSTSTTKRHTRLNTGQTFINYDSGFSVKLNSLSESKGASVTVSFVIPATTTTSVAIEPAKQTYGSTSPATIALSVTASKGPTPTGNVRVYNGKSKIATVMLNGSGTASVVAPSTFSVGTHTITAKFTPDGTAQDPSTSRAAALTVVKIPSTVAITPVSARVTKGHGETLTATVTAPGVTAPTGTLTVYGNGKKLKSYTLTSSEKGKRTLSLPAFGVRGTKTFTVHYSGSTDIGSSISPVSTTTVV